MRRTAAERLRSRLAADAIRIGKIRVPIVCSHCGSPSLSEDPRERTLVCLPCGRHTSAELAHRLRRQTLRRIILDGIDIPQAIEFGLLGSSGAKTPRAKTPT
jgi:hypothetical protein